MDILTRPRDFVERELRVDEKLIYGDFDGENLVLYSTSALPGYLQEREVYVKRLDIEDPSILADNKKLADSFAAPKTKGGPVLLRFDGYNEPTLFSGYRPYAYVCSNALMRKIDPEMFEYYQQKHSFLLDLPPDASMVHEASHLSLSPNHHRESASFRFDDFLPFLCRHLKSPINDVDVDQIMDETIGIFMELKYIEIFYPEFAQRYRDWRSEEKNDSYKTAYQLICDKPKEVERFVSVIRFSRGWPIRKLVEWSHS